jgi:PAS domain-containing protein
MRIKANRTRDKAVPPAPQQQRRRSKRRSSGGTRNLQARYAQSRATGRSKIDPAQWLAFIAIALISVTLIVMIWTLTTRAIGEQAIELRARTDQQVGSVAFVLAREIQDELQLVDQSLAIIQDAWTQDPDAVDLGAWRKQSLALTDVANDIFIANDHGVIVQGTLPQSIGQGFGSAYVTYPNGSLETFDPDRTINTNGKLPDANGVKARQFLTYILRPLARPEGWMIGASYRSEGITKLLAGARLGQTGIIALIALRRGGLQAIAGPSAQSANMDIASSELIEQMRKNDAGIWAGVSPIDDVSRIFAYQHIPNRDMSVLVGISRDEANEALAGLAATARGLAALGSLVVLTIAAILVWTIATARAARQRRRNQERSEIDLNNTRQELAMARARALLSEAEAGALIGSATDGVARLDAAHKLRLWNERFGERAGVVLGEEAVGNPVEGLFRGQAAAGLFGDAADADSTIATRLTLLRTEAGSAEALTQTGPNGELLRLTVRGVSDGGHLLVLTRADNSGLGVLEDAGDPAAAQDATDW